MTRMIHCPICKKLTVFEGNTFRPFCSERCKKLDLGAWASGNYVVKGKIEADDQQTKREDDLENIPNID